MKPIPPASSTPLYRQRGIILLTTLVAMVILMISAVALVRSFDSTTVLSGSMAFKRDLTNQGERGVGNAFTLLNTGGALATEAVRTAHSLNNNYSASILPSNNRGVPLALINDTTYAGAGMTAPDITDNGVTVRYVIDRQCMAVGAFDASSCAYMQGNSDAGGTGWLKKAGSGYLPVYRISVRVSGPRNTQVFLQTTVTR